MLHALLHTGLALLLSTPLSLVPATPTTSSAGVSTRSPTAAANSTRAPAAAEIVVELNACMRSCAETPRRRTDRHTCALTCELVASTEIDALDLEQAFQADMTIAWRDACVTGCETDPSLSANNRQTCLLTCEDTAEALCGGWAAPVRDDGGLS